MADDSLLRIGELASKSGVTPRTIRFYVQGGLLPQPVKSRKTLALYREDCVNKIKAIKKAQTERFLPLVVIREILEENNYDYNALFLDRSPETSGRYRAGPATNHTGTEQLNLKKVCQDLGIPVEAIDELKGLQWIRPVQNKESETISSIEYDFLYRFSQLLKTGMAWRYATDLFIAIKDVVEKSVDMELRSIIHWIMKSPRSDFETVLSLEENASRSFAKLIRMGCIKDMIQQLKITSDNAYRATADEGFALPEGEIIAQIRDLEKNLSVKFPDVRVLGDIAMGYSCIGNLDQSQGYLRRVLKIEPQNVEAQVRLIWYRRFARRKSEQVKLKKSLEEIIEKNPDYALGHAYLSAWYALEISETDDHNQILRIINRCFHELEQVDVIRPRDLHEWVLVHYAKGRIPFVASLSTDSQLESINAFEEIIEHKDEINAYYQKRMQFFPQWLWPNIYYFYGFSLMELGRYTSAQKILSEANHFNVVSPFHMRLQEALTIIKEHKTAHKKGVDPK